MQKKNGFLESRILKGVDLNNEEISFGTGLIWILGPNATFQNCKLVCKVKASEFVVSTTTLLACEFTATIQLKQVDWSPVKMIDCVFWGSYLDCDFGPRPDIGGKRAHGIIMNGDFSGVVFDACRFFNVDIRSTKFPPWPCFTIIDRETAAKDFMTFDYSSEAKRYAQARIGNPEEGEVAFCLCAKTEAKLLNCREEQLATFLNSKPYVI